MELAVLVIAATVFKKLRWKVACVDSGVFSHKVRYLYFFFFFFLLKCLSVVGFWLNFILLL